MYIRHLHVDHLKRLRDFKLDFTDKHGKPRMWTVLIGENGTAKTTILQAIALAAAGSKQVNTIAGPIVKHIRDRREDKPMTIDAHFDFTPRSDGKEIHPLAPKQSSRNLRLHSHVSLQSGISTSLDADAKYVDGKTGTVALGADPKDPLDQARSVHTRLWFVAGYGIFRTLPNTNVIPDIVRPSIERMDPLFKPTAAMTSTAFAEHFLNMDKEAGRAKGTTSRMFSRMLNQAIKIGGKDLLPDISKLELRGQGGTSRSSDLVETDRFHQRMGKYDVKIAGAALSNGYQSTFAWIADLIGHVLLEAGEEVDPREMEGLVLIDEIDAYLHPQWQATLVTAFRRIFPKMQFIATTHSPVVLAAAAPNEIVRLVVDDETGHVEQKRWEAVDGSAEIPGPDPRIMTGGELYRIWFDVDRLTPNPHGEALERYLLLANDPFRTAENNKELARLEKELAAANIDPGVKSVRQKKPT